MTRQTRIEYEWDIETYDEHGDIIDHDHSDRCPGQPRVGKLVLVRNVFEGEREYFEDTADLKDRAWAYVGIDGKLPATFDDGEKVPKRFHKELAALIATKSE
jgi:hypothetical protein